MNIEIHWDGGAMHLTQTFFEEQGVLKARKALRLLLDDPDWTALRRSELAAELRQTAKENSAEARRLCDEAGASRLAAKKLRGSHMRKEDPAYFAYRRALDAADTADKRSRRLQKGARVMEEIAGLLEGTL